MSILSLHIGQCGNQLGDQILDTIYNDCYGCKQQISSLHELDYLSESTSTFFEQTQAERLEARCIQIDMEEKVISRLRRPNRQTKGWQYPVDSKYTEKCGSGNNWAYGFFVHADRIAEKVAPPFRKQLERCDSLDGLLVTMSLAGGTGSGVGTRLLLQISDILPKTPVLTQLVWPYLKGEVSVQAYNVILTLGHLLSSDTASNLDGFVLHHNDVLHGVCSNRLLATDPNYSIGLDELNQLAAHQLVGLLQPYFNSSQPSSTTPVSRRITDILLSLCCHPDYRLIQLRCLPYYGSRCRDFATETWAQLARHGRQILLTGAGSEDRLDWSTTATGLAAMERMKHTYYPLLGCTAVLRGEDAMDHIRNPIAFSHDLTHDLKTFKLNLKSSSCLLHGHKRSFMEYPRSLFLACNGGGTRLSADGDSNIPTRSIGTSLNQAVARAWEIFASKAYLHQYERYGLESDQLMDCFANVEQIAHGYSNLSWS